MGVSEKMDYRDTFRLAIEIAAQEITYCNCATEGPALKRCPHLSLQQSLDDKLIPTVLALLDKVRQTQAAECAKHVPLVGSLGEVIGCHECDWRSVGENGVDEWREHLTALGRK